MVVLVFVALVTPVQVGLLDIDVGPLFLVNIFVDLIFVVDMVLQFFMMYRRNSGLRRIPEEVLGTLEAFRRALNISIGILKKFLRSSEEFSRVPQEFLANS